MTKSNLINRIDKEINENGIPSSLKSGKYNKTTIAAIGEGRKMDMNLEVKGFWSIERL